jgi:hypothetical protein
MSLRLTLFAASLLALTFAAFPVDAQARQSRSHTGQVVHTRRLPVILHRAVPPQYGKHVYVGRR